MLLPGASCSAWLYNRLLDVGKGNKKENSVPAGSHEGGLLNWWLTSVLTPTVHQSQSAVFSHSFSFNTLQSGEPVVTHQTSWLESTVCKVLQLCECREFDRVAEPDARLGLVAMQLGQVEEAKKLFTCAARPDLLNKLFQVCVC